MTATEADALADLLRRNFGAGGADFVVTAPFGDEALLTLTGAVDFRSSVGQAEMVTTFGALTDTRMVHFTERELWFGEVSGLPAALAEGGAPGAAYLRRPVVDGAAAGGAGVPLVDVVVAMVLNLSARVADDPRAFLAAPYTWEGQRSIDSRLTSLFGLREDRTVAVDAQDDLLTQFVTPLADGGIEVTVTLSDHGNRQVDLPPDDETAEAADHAELAARLGI